MNVTSLITVEYENKSNWTLGENEPNTNPIKANPPGGPFKKKRKCKFGVELDFSISDV